MPVISELLQGTRSTREETIVLQRFVEPVPAPRRVAATPDEWTATGRLVAKMLRAGHDPSELARRSFYLDVHLAQICRARGITLMTDAADHARIQPYVH